MKKLSQTSLKIMVRILQASKFDICNDRNEFICHAIHDNCHGESENALANYLQKWIYSMMGKDPEKVCYSLGQWYEDKFGYTPMHYDADKIQSARIRWVNWMIKELEKEIK